MRNGVENHMQGKLIEWVLRGSTIRAVEYRAARASNMVAKARGETAAVQFLNELRTARRKAAKG